MRIQSRLPGRRSRSGEALRKNRIIAAIAAIIPYLIACLNFAHPYRHTNSTSKNRRSPHERDQTKAILQTAPDGGGRPYPQGRHETGLAIKQTESRGPPGPLLIDFIVLLRDFAGGAVLEFRRTFFFPILYALCNVIRQVAVPVLSIAAAAAARSCGAGCPGCGKRRFSPYSDSKDPQA